MKRESLVLILPMLSLGVQACQRPPERRMATELSKLATTPEQARLWQQAADQGIAAALLKLERPGESVRSRQTSSAANQAIPQAQGSVIPAGVVGGLRIISTSGLANAEFVGPARIVAVTGEQLSLDLGNKRTITFQARVDGQALGVSPGQTVRLEYRVRNERFNRRQIVAVRAPAGPGIARITETGPSPVSVSVSSFGLVATQVRARNGAYTNVDVRVGTDRKTIAPGDIAQIGGMTVGLMASRGTSGREARTIEGSPYSIELIAWSSR